MIFEELIPPRLNMEISNSTIDAMKCLNMLGNGTDYNDSDNDKNNDLVITILPIIVMNDNKATS